MQKRRTRIYTLSKCNTALGIYRGTIPPAHAVLPVQVLLPCLRGGDDVVIISIIIRTFSNKGDLRTWIGTKVKDIFRCLLKEKDSMPCGITPLTSQKDARGLQAQLACKGITHKPPQTHLHKHAFSPPAGKREKRKRWRRGAWGKRDRMPLSQYEDNSRRYANGLNSPTDMKERGDYAPAGAITRRIRAERPNQINYS